MINWELQSPSIKLEIHSKIGVARMFWAKAVPLEPVSIEPAKVTNLEGITPM